MTGSYLLIIAKSNGSFGWMITDNPTVPKDCIGVDEMAFTIRPIDFLTSKPVDPTEGPPDTTFDDVMHILRRMAIYTNETIADEIIDYFKKEKVDG